MSLHELKAWLIYIAIWTVPWAVLLLLAYLLIVLNGVH